MSIHVAPARPRARRLAVAVSSVLALVILGSVSYRVLAQTGLGSFEPGVESEIWQQLTAFGQRINPSCTNSDLAGTVCSNGLPPPLGEMLFPIGVAADGGNIYITDQFNNRIQAFDFSGNPLPLATFQPIGNGLPGGGANQLNQPEGLAVDAAHKLVVGDSLNDRVPVFNANGSFAFE